ncbi:DUF2795 domain-containing protein [Streptomyces sp. CC53]|uniref:DUF2795 domain-containing protein n=1 Tax=unclassified Streptomyces TaxID=2593676 RepID=UPI0008DE9648|nr:MULTISPECIES: DUF2795 domain-containing protein [unclassified Streptomyces]OII62486.1 DUF2795 domain-containing protein [Streptomyces sp. CC53]OII64902.1 DUF2795 domain-containing protein [Streptomyces sp. CC77]
MQRGSDRLSRHHDDEMKHQLQGLLRSGHPTRVEEWHDPEPTADDDPELAMGGRVPSDTFEALRLELARHLARTPFPAHRGDLLRILRERHAPDPLRERVESLPGDHTYRSVQEVAKALHRG